MSKNILLISVQTVKDRTGVHANVDDKMVLHEIKVAQDTHIHRALGSDLFHRLQTASDPDTAEVFTADERTLVSDYLTDALAWFVVAALPLSSSFQFYTKGVQQRTDPNANAATMSDLLTLADHYRNRAEMYLEKMIRYLDANEELFELYTNSQSTDDGIGPAGTGFTSGMYLWDDEVRCEDER